MNNTENSGGFAAGTLIHTQTGFKPIEEIKVGDWVLSHPEKEMPVAEHIWKECEDEDEVMNPYCQVTKVFVHDNAKISYMTCMIFESIFGVPLPNPPRNKSDSFRMEIFGVTPEHLFWVAYHSWTPVSMMSGESIVVMADGYNCPVCKVIHTDIEARVFNIEVDECHTYFVGKLGMWVRDTIQQAS